MINMDEVLIKFLQSSAITQTLLGGLPIDHLIANFVSACLPKIMKIGG